MNNESLTFLSASNIGSYLFTDARTGGKERVYSTTFTKEGFVFNDFVGLNTNINEPMTPAENFLGHAEQTVTSVDDYSYQGGLISSLSPQSPSVVDNVTGTILNGLIHHRQGPYGWPTWKQIRGAGHPLARYWRENNVIPITTGQYYASPLDKGILTISLNTTKYNLGNTTVQYIEPPLTSRFYPLEHAFIVDQDKKNINLNLRHSYGNLTSHYSNQKLNISMGKVSYLKQGFDPIYDDLKEIYIDKKYAADATETSPFGEQVPFKKYINFIYSETLFPRETNTYLSKVRKRTNYAEEAGFGPNGYDRISHREFWKNGSYDNGLGTILTAFKSAAPRNLRTPAISLNSQGYTTVGIQSVWDLDTSLSGATTTQGNRPYLGELQSVIAMSSSCRLGQSSQWGMYLLTASICAHRAPIWQTTASAVDDQLYRGIPIYMTDQVSGKAPFFNSYEDFAEDIRGLGKSCSILPEFRISEYMDYYINSKGGNFRATNNNFLSIDGATIPSSSYSSVTGAVNPNFFADYSHSDFLKYFNFFKKDHKEIGVKVNQYSVSARAIMKLLPYNGFYPPQRAKQLGTLFSQSYGDHISGSLIYQKFGTGPNDTRPVSSAQTMGLNSLLRPFVSPGIVFNSLKSGIAVDYPVSTGSSNNRYGYMSTPYQQPVTSYWKFGKDYRLPFEAAIEPHEYIPIYPKRLGELPASINEALGIIWDEPDGTGDEGTPGSNGAYWGAVCFWNGNRDPLYSLAASNFFGETPRFFLKDEKFTDFVSERQSNWKPAEPTKTYYMDVVLKKTEDMVVCEGSYEPGTGQYTGSANQRGLIYGPAHSSSWGEHGGGTTIFTQIKDPVYAAYTPPYFYEDSIARIAYTPTASGVPAIDDLLSAIQGTITSVNGATAANAFGGSAISGTFFTGSSVFLGLDDAASNNKMKITASVNLRGKSRYKQVKYGTNTGPDGNFVPIGFDDTTNNGFEAWNIASKFECPTLNFSRSLKPELYNASTGRGIWGGYADSEHGIPTGSTGVWLELRESFPQRSGRGAGSIAATTGSLIDLCGFKPRKKRVGKLADSKTISEAIVAIPYVRKGDVNNEKSATPDIDIPPIHQFPGLYSDQLVFSIDSEEKDIFNSVLAELNKGLKPEEILSSVSVAKMITAMKKYNVPPALDFVQFNGDIKPFAMYILEFSHELSRQDLSDIWQGLMPEISRTAKLQHSNFTHNAGPFEFFQNKELPSYTRWMLFKIKKKAEKSYFNVTADASDDSRFKFKFKNGEEPETPAYNYNWPYDFFSLVELTKLDASVEFKPSAPVMEFFTQPVENVAAPPAAAAAIPAGGLLGGK